MTADQFVAAVREGDAKFRVTKILLNAEGQKIRGQGSLTVVKDGFEINLEVPSNYQVPDPKRLIWKAVHSWNVTGLIEGELKFASDRVTPAGKNSSWGFRRKPLHIQTLRLDKIHLVPAGLDAIPKATRDRILQRPPTKRSKYTDVEFHAVIFDCEPVFLNAGTDTKAKNDFLGAYHGGSALDTFIDRGRTYDFAFIRKEKDLRVYFRSKNEFHSISVEDDWRRFHAFLMGVGFTHGFQPWPYRIEYWRAGRKVDDQFRPPIKLTRTRYAPFDRRIGSLGNLGKKGSCNSVVRLAANFFEKKTPLSEEISRLLFLVRETGSASFHTQTLALCSLFEGVVTLIFDGLKLEEKLRQTDPQFGEYLSLRNRLIKRLRVLAIKGKRPSYDRIAGSLSSAKEFRIQDKFKAICQHFNLSYEKGMQLHFEAWNRKRNPFMHGNWKEEDSDFSDQALIAGAINIFVLKLMRYSGRVKFDTFVHGEDYRYKVI